VAPFKQGLLKHALKIWQLVPEYPDGQLQKKVEPVPVVVQVAPFKHGLFEQAFVTL